MTPEAIKVLTGIVEGERLSTVLYKDVLGNFKEVTEIGVSDEAPLAMMHIGCVELDECELSDFYLARGLG